MAGAGNDDIVCTDGIARAASTNLALDASYNPNRSVSSADVGLFLQSEDEQQQSKDGQRLSKCGERHNRTNQQRSKRNQKASRLSSSFVPRYPDLGALSSGDASTSLTDQLAAFSTLVVEEESPSGTSAPGQTSRSPPPDQFLDKDYLSSPDHFFSSSSDNDLMTAVDKLDAGERAKQLEPVKILGKGTFATVSLVKKRGTNEMFALKAVNKQFINKNRQMQRVVKEQFLLKKVVRDNPFFTKLFSTFEDVTNIYLLLEYASGGDLFECLRRNKAFSLKQARFFVAEVDVALAFLHDATVCFRDLKPENILIEGSGHIKLCDFGFATLLGPGERSFSMCGTPEYCAPELFLGRGHDHAVDLWALGILLFEMLAGRPPFRQTDRMALYQLIIVGQVQCPFYFDPYAVHLIHGLLETDPSIRFRHRDVQQHHLFGGLDWAVVKARGLQPPFELF